MAIKRTYICSQRGKIVTDTRTGMCLRCPVCSPITPAPTERIVIMKEQPIGVTIALQKLGVIKDD